MERNIKPEQELSGAYTGFTGLMCRENDGVLELWDAATATWSPLKTRFTAGKPVWHPGLLGVPTVAVDELAETPAIFMAVIPVSCGRKACGVRYASHCAEGQ